MLQTELSIGKDGFYPLLVQLDSQEIHLMSGESILEPIELGYCMRNLLTSNCRIVRKQVMEQVNRGMKS